MAGFNQKGPLEQGSMTGRGLGRCASSRQEDEIVDFVGEKRPLFLQQRQRRGCNERMTNVNAHRFFRRGNR